MNNQNNRETWRCVHRLAITAGIVCAAFCATSTAWAWTGHSAIAADTEPTEAPAEFKNRLERPPPGRTRAIRLVITDEPPEIDGRLDESAWTKASASGAFWITEQERWPDEPTEVLVLGDGTTMYFAFRAHDSDPQQIRAIETVRDRGLGFDDQVVVEIDTYGDHKGVSRFAVNANGTQTDSIAGGRASRISWKGDWQAAVSRTENGWIAEIAVPYEILNYRPGASEFAIQFARYHHRTRQWSYWADVTPQNKREEMGRLIGFDAPERQKQNAWTLMPFVLGGVNVIDRDGKFQDELVSAGMDILYTPSSNTTGVLSLNPDFTQVETQITDANFSYNEKAVADPRVFFQEGSAYFGNDNRIFYSPRVPDFDAGGKFFGQEGAFRYGGLITFSPDSRMDAAARLAFAADATHSGSLILVRSDREDFDENTFAFSAEGREKIGTFWDTDFAWTRNKRQGGTDQKGIMYDVRGGWQADFWSAGLRLDQYDRDFSPANGLVLADRLGTEGRNAFVGYYRNLGRQTISEAALDIVQTERKTDDGRTQYSGWYTGGALEWNTFVRTGLYYTDGDYRPLTGNAPGEFSDQVNHDRFWTVSLDFNTRSSRLVYGASYASGQLGGGDYKYVFGYVRARPTDTTSLSISAEELTSFGTFRQYVVEAGWDITETNSLIFRHIYSNDDAYWRLGFRRVVREGLDVFALYDEEPGGEPAVSIKLLWTIPKISRPIDRKPNLKSWY